MVNLCRELLWSIYVGYYYGQSMQGIIMINMQYAWDSYDQSIHGIVICNLCNEFL